VVGMALVHGQERQDRSPAGIVAQVHPVLPGGRQAGGMRAAWDARRVAAVAAGGVAGATLRWAVLTSVTTGRFPWSVLLLNVAGSLVLGALLAEEWTHPAARLLLHDLGGIGFCGGVTTFSTFAFEVTELLRDGHPSVAVPYALASVAGSLVAIVVGAAALKGVRAITLPLEGRP
jgi:fluoride exporter